VQWIFSKVAVQSGEDKKQCRRRRSSIYQEKAINPCQNPVIYDNGGISPAGALYNPDKAGTFSHVHPIVREFLRRGWQWGANFKTLKDYHHFDKPASMSLT